MRQSVKNERWRDPLPVMCECRSFTIDDQLVAVSFSEQR